MKKNFLLILSLMLAFMACKEEVSESTNSHQQDQLGTYLNNYNYQGFDLKSYVWPQCGSFHNAGVLHLIENELNWSLPKDSIILQITNYTTSNSGIDFTYEYNTINNILDTGSNDNFHSAVMQNLGTGLSTELQSALNNCYNDLMATLNPLDMISIFEFHENNPPNFSIALDSNAFINAMIIGKNSTELWFESTPEHPQGIIKWIKNLFSGPDPDKDKKDRYQNIVWADVIVSICTWNPFGGLGASAVTAIMIEN